MMTRTNAAVQRWWLHPRFLVVAIASAIAFLSVLGLTTRAAFSNQSSLKIILAALVPTVVVILANSKRTTEILTASLIFAAPFAFGSIRGGVALTPALVVLVPTVLVVYLQRSGSVHTKTFTATIGSLVLLSPAFIAGRTPLAYVQLIGIGLGTAYVVGTVARSPIGRRTLIAAFVGSAGLQSTLATWEFVTGRRLNLYGATNGSLFGNDYFFNFADKARAAAAFSDPISLGNVLALAVPMTIIAAFTFHRLWQRILLAATGVMLVLGLTATLSRLSWVGATAGALVAVALLPRPTRLRAAGSLLVVGTISIGAALSIGGAPLIERFTSLENPTSSQVLTSSQDKVRLELQSTALSIGESHPVTGVGFGNLEPYLLSRVPQAGVGTHAHNTYYQLFAESGILGLLVLALLLIGTVGRLWFLRAADRLLAAGCTGAIVAFAFTSTTDFTVRFTTVMAMTACIFGLSSSVRPRKSSCLASPQRVEVGSGV